MLTAIIVAAGSSRRMGFNKLFANIAGAPVIAHTICAFEEAGSVRAIVVVACVDRHAETGKIARDRSIKKVRSSVIGGEHRPDSVRAGLPRLRRDAKYGAVPSAAPRR